MIKILTTKDKFKATIQALQIIIDKLAKDKYQYQEWDRVFANAYLGTLNTLSRKLRSKLINLEEKPSNHRFRYSIDPIHAAAFMYYYRMQAFKEKLNPYCISVMEEVSGSVLLKLLV